MTSTFQEPGQGVVYDLSTEEPERAEEIEDEKLTEQQPTENLKIETDGSALEGPAPAKNVEEPAPAKDVEEPASAKDDNIKAEEKNLSFCARVNSAFAGFLFPRLTPIPPGAFAVLTIFAAIP